MFFNPVQFLSDKLVVLLDKFKFKNPLAYGFTAVVLAYFFFLLNENKVIIPDVSFLMPILNFVGIETINGFIMAVLGATLVVIAPHTAEKVKEIQK